MTYIFGNAQNMGARAQQQDSFCFSNPQDHALASHGGILAVLADGMGGLSHGDAAAHTATATFLAAYSRKTHDEPIPQALERSLLEANAAVHSLARQYAADGELGTTLVAAVLHGNQLHWISVGDSAILLRRGDQLAQLNTPHIYAVMLDARVAAGQITPGAALADPQREALTSHVGLEQIPHIDRTARPLPLDPGDMVLLASDGLFKTLASDEMLAVMQGTPQQQCDRLVEETIARRLENQDNVTVMAFAQSAVDSAAGAPPAAALTDSVPSGLLEPLIEPCTAPETSDLPPAQEPEQPTPARRGRAVFAGAAVVLAILAGAGYWWMNTTCCEPPPVALPPAALPSAPEAVPSDTQASAEELPAPPGDTVAPPGENQAAPAPPPSGHMDLPGGDSPPPESLPPPEVRKRGRARR
ncbi:MAG: protein phosphatase 2C domain-containing protein [Bryobacteraceae bacterium]